MLDFEDALFHSFSSVALEVAFERAKAMGEFWGGKGREGIFECSDGSEILPATLWFSLRRVV